MMVLVVLVVVLGLRVGLWGRLESPPCLRLGQQRGLARGGLCGSWRPVPEAVEGGAGCGSPCPGPPAGLLAMLKRASRTQEVSAHGGEGGEEKGNFAGSP